jgi:hypothetical protein
MLLTGKVSVLSEDWNYIIFYKVIWSSHRWHSSLWCGCGRVFDIVVGRHSTSDLADRAKTYKEKVSKIRDLDWREHVNLNHENLGARLM